MRAIINLVVVGAGIAMLANTPPAAAQYPAYGYPSGGYGQPYQYGYGNGYGQPYPNGYGNGYGQPYPNSYGNGYGQPYSNSYGNAYGQPYADAYGATTQIAVNRCAEAVQVRLDRSGEGYGYGYAQGSGGRVLGISSVDPGGYGGAVTVRGVASSGRNAPYGYGSPAPVDLTWQCTADYRGMIVGLSIQPAERAYGNQVYQRSPYGNDDYSEYGYRRY